jgi:hypothetical protein
MCRGCGNPLPPAIAVMGICAWCLAEADRRPQIATPGYRFSAETESRE